MTPDTKLTPAQEVERLMDLYKGDRARILDEVRDAFNVLQGRAQLLISLVTICLTIAGFSGPNIAASGTPAKIGVSVGLSLVIASAVVTLLGPLQMRWATQWSAGSIDDTLVNLVALRNKRTALYHVALGLLCFGLSGYVAATVSYMLHR